MKRNFKSIALVALLAVSGLFGAAASLKIEPNYVESRAEGTLYETVDGVDYRVIYLSIDADWEHQANMGIDNYNWRYVYSTNSGTSNTIVQFGKTDTTGKSFHYFIGIQTFKIYLPNNTTHFQVRTRDEDKSRSQTAYQKLSDLTPGQDSHFLIQYDHWNSRGAADAWVDEATFDARFYKNYFTVSSSWHNGEAGLATDYIYSYYWSSVNPSRVSNQATCTPITSNMIHQFSSGKHYAEVLIPIGNGNTQFNMQNAAGTWSEPGNGNYINKGDLAANMQYTITTSYGASKQDYTYQAFTLDSNYYLVGSGSFSSLDWSTLGGVQMDYSVGDNGVLMNQWLEAGDIFKITNGSDWYGWNSNDGSTDTTDFQHTSYKDKDEHTYRLYFSVQELNSWWHRNENNTYAYIYNSDSNKLSAWPGEKMTRYGTTDYYYVDITATKKYSYVIFNSYNDGNKTEDLSMVDLINTDCYWAKNEWPSSGVFKVYDPGYADYDSKVLNDNIRVQTSGYYNIFFNSSYNIYIEPALSEEVYLDLNSINWEEYDHKIAAYFWNTASPSTAKCVKMTLVHGHGGSTRIFEAIVPVVGSNLPNRVIYYSYTNFYENTMGTEGVDWHKKTGDLSATGGQNKYKLTGWDSGDNICPGTWDGQITNTMRANYYGNYFQTDIGCLQAGTREPTGDWSAFEEEYNNMHKDIQGIVWLASPNPSGSDVEHAMATYDYIVDKYGTAKYPDFINRSHPDSGSLILHGRTGNNNFSLLGINDNSFTTIIIVIASSVSLLSITALSILLVKKRKIKRTN